MRETPSGLADDDDIIVETHVVHPQIKEHRGQFPEDEIVGQIPGGTVVGGTQEGEILEYVGREFVERGFCVLRFLG